MKLFISEPATDLNWQTMDHWRNHATVILTDGTRPKDTMVSIDILNVTGLVVDNWKALGHKAEFVLERKRDRFRLFKIESPIKILYYKLFQYVLQNRGSS